MDNGQKKSINNKIKMGMNNKQQFDPRAGGRDRLLRFGETQPGKPTQPVSQGKEANTA